MGQNDLTFWSMFANSLFNRHKNMFVFIFISQISYKQMESGTKVHTVAKHSTEVIKQTECFGFSNILCEHASLLQTPTPLSVKSNDSNKRPGVYQSFAVLSRPL